jgi:hypothetical protein
MRFSGFVGRIGVALALLVMAASPANADKCTGAKLKAISKKEAGLLGCQAKVAAKNDSSGLFACETKVMEKFGAAFAKAGVCAGDQMTCENIADGCESIVASAMTDTFPSPCEAAKRKAAGKLAKGELGCYSKAAAKSAPVDTIACIPKAQKKFSGALTKAGACPDGGSPQSLVEDNCVTPAVTTDGGGMVTDVCPTTSTTTTTSSTTTSSTSSTTTTSTSTTTTTTLSCYPPAPYVPLDAGAVGIPTSGLAVWVRADVGVGLDGSSRPCSWDDQSGNGFNLEQVNPALRPTVDPTGIGGQSALHFLGSQGLIRGDVLGIPATSARTFIGVIEPVSVTGRANSFQQGISGDCCIHTGLDMNTYATAGQRFGLRVTNSTFDTNFATNTNPHIEVLTIDDLTPGLTITAHTTYHLDGMLGTLTLRSGTGVTDSFAGANYSTIFTQGGEMVFAEAIVYSRALSDPERQMVQGYLGTRYGISVP